jgi:hypothetical protein
MIRSTLERVIPERPLAFFQGVRPTQTQILQSAITEHRQLPTLTRQFRPAP